MFCFWRFSACVLWVVFILLFFLRFTKLIFLQVISVSESVQGVFFYFLCLDSYRILSLYILIIINTPLYKEHIITELLTPCYGEPEKKETAVYGLHTKRQIMNPILNVTYTFLKHLYSEIGRVFPDRFVHLGMDEIYPACW